MRIVFRFIDLLAGDLALTFFFAVRAAWSRDLNWLWLAAATLIIETASKVWLLLRRHRHVQAAIMRGIFERYSSCEFRQVSVRQYFADSPGTFEEVLKLLPRKFLRSSSRARRIESLTGEIPGVPHVILATRKAESPKPTEEPSPTSFETPDDGWIFTSQPAESGAILTRFVLLHEIYHHIEPMPVDLKRNTLWDANKIALAVLILVQISLPSTLTILALLWILYCSVAEYDIDRSANELTCEVRADTFALDRTPHHHLPLLLKYFNSQCEIARKKNSALAREGYVRWHEAIENCQHRIGMLQGARYWALGSAPAPKYSSVAAPLLLAVISVQPWRWPHPPSVLSTWLFIVGSVALVFYSLLTMGAWFFFANLRRTKAPFKTEVPSLYVSSEAADNISLSSW